MAKSKAKIGYKAKLGIWNGVSFDYLAEITSLTPPGWARDTVDVTHMESPNKTKEFIGGLIEAGDAKANINYVPAVADQMLQAFLAESGRYRILFPGGAVALDFDGIVTSYEIQDVAPADKMAAAITIKASGLPEYAVVGVPVNSLLPAVIGAAIVGGTLTAFVGQWVSAESFAYQWFADGVAIAGATAATYAPVAGNGGKAITVAITATNGAGTAVATSGATSNVAAA